MGDFRLGSVFGFEIRIDFSWFIIFFLILWTFTVAVFPANFPGLSRGAYLGMGVVGALLFFSSLLAHELSHSLVARRKGIPVEGITLFIFGGMARTRMEAEQPGDEFYIAVVGPVSSILIGLLFGLIWWLGTRLGWSTAITGVALYLGFLNIALAVFNLLPGFPLDGGRLFRSLVWKITGDVTRATRIASTGGKWLGYVLVALGVLQVFGGALVGGLWMVFIGWFLRNAAIVSYEQHLVRLALEGVPAWQIMSRDPETVQPDLTLQALVDDYFLRRRYQAFPVSTDGTPLGIITMHQVKDVPREEWPQRTVAETMTPADETVTVRPEESMVRVLERMEQSGTRRVLVTRNGQLVGIITAADISDWLRRAREFERI
ncbi:MAG TPA: site-2 protease family protein [Longimicrobiales bacterium]|nr:site-2 protease family protein [Longimicrobiales bacterium]